MTSFKILSWKERGTSEAGGEVFSANAPVLCCDYPSTTLRAVPLPLRGRIEVL
jgi:hypothetical protein